ncbi:MAG: hypothetical protein ACQESR_03350 [Planctomycetota bacterium]
MERCSTQAVLPLVGLATDQVIRDRHTSGGRISPGGTLPDASRPPGGRTRDGPSHPRPAYFAYHKMQSRSDPYKEGTGHYEKSRSDPGPGQTREDGLCPLPPILGGSFAAATGSARLSRRVFQLYSSVSCLVPTS